MASQTQQTQTQESGYYPYDQSFDLSRTFARFVSTTNTTRFETVTLPKHGSGYVYKFGRNRTCDVILPGTRFSNIHFKVWETETEDSVYGEQRNIIIVQDMSTNGTYLNQARLGKGQTSVLNNGDELAAGIGVPDDEVRYLVQLPKGSRPNLQPLSPEAEASRQKYEIRDVLGHGAFAVVRLAVKRATGELFAVKILNQRKLAITNASAKATELFKREIEILQSTRHPNIVQYVDMWSDTTEIYLVLEFLAGGDLMDYVIKRGKLEEPTTVKIVRQILDALIYCHRLGIAHRDIKPENILLTKDDPPIAKLTDFGLAKMVEPGTFLKTFCGTLTYVAPEVISMHGRIAGAYSYAVDMWSVGCVTFIMVTGAMPFAAEGQEAMMQIIQDGDYDNGLLDEVELSGPGVDFIEGLLRIDPGSRMTGEQAVQHSWISQSDYHQRLNNYPNGLPQDMHEEFDMENNNNTSSNSMSIDRVSKARSSTESRTNAQVPRDESLAPINQTDGAPAIVYNNWKGQCYPDNCNSRDSSRTPQFPNDVSHFSDSSSYRFLGSSQYVSTSSQAGLQDSNATITPQKMKAQQQGKQQQQQQQQALFNGKENIYKPRLHQSEPVFRQH